MLALYCLDILDVAQDHTRYTAANLKVYTTTNFLNYICSSLEFWLEKYPMGLIVDETEVYIDLLEPR